jgi:hypothetical protein
VIEIPQQYRRLSASSEYVMRFIAACLSCIILSIQAVASGKKMAYHPGNRCSWAALWYWLLMIVGLKPSKNSPIAANANHDDWVESRSIL